MTAARQSRGPAVTLLFLAVVAASALLAFVTLRVTGSNFGGPAERYASSKRPRDTGELPKLWKAPDFSYQDQRGREVTRDALQGQPWIADFIYTQCTSACPMMTARMVLLDRALAGAAVRFVSFSVDPAHDTPAALAAYQQGWRVGDARWTLLSTEPSRLKETASGFRVTNVEIGGPTNAILHSSVFLLVDGAGWVRGVYESNDQDAQAELVADARALAAARAAPPPPGEGSLYAALGCAGCHENRRVAPALSGLVGAEVSLDDGSKVVADEAYVRRAIVDPEGEVVAGYAPLMPSYRASLSDRELDALVTEVSAMGGGDTASAADAPSVALVVDPVCKMTVRAEPSAPHTTYQGKDVYFCSETCRDAFVKDPSKYPATEGPAQPQ